MGVCQRIKVIGVKVLVTGGTVFASRFCAEYFLKKGHEVFVINRGTKPQSAGVNLIECDRHSLGDRLKDLYFDLVLDVTAYNEYDVKALVSALGDYGRYILISSSAVYPETLKVPFNEGQECGANKFWGDYGLNKLAAERYLLNNSDNFYIIRPPYLYGSMNNLYREAFVFECAERDMPFYVPGDGKMPLQFFHIEDMCGFAEILTEKAPVQRIFNVGNTETVTVEEWVKACYNVLGKIPRIRCVAGHEESNYFCFRNYGFSLDVTGQGKLMPGTKPLDKGLTESYEWFKDNRELIRRKDYFKYISDNFEGGEI